METPTRSSHRQRTQVNLYNPSESTTSHSIRKRTNDDVLKLGEGPGVPLGEIESISQNFKQIPSDHPRLDELHRILYNTRGKEHLRKKWIRQFSGYNYGKVTGLEHSLVMERLLKRKTTILRDLCETLNLEKNGTSENLAQRLCAFLEKPSEKAMKKGSNGSGANGSKKSSSKKAMTSPTTKRSHGIGTAGGAGTKTKKQKISGGDKVKKPLNAYLLFAQEHRTQIAKANPDSSITQIAQQLGEQWRNLSEAKKKVYKEKEAQLKVQYMKEQKKSGLTKKIAPAKKRSTKGKEKSGATTTKKNQRRQSPKTHGKNEDENPMEEDHEKEEKVHSDEEEQKEVEGEAEGSEEDSDEDEDTKE